jgi:type I restriction enzyme S subunit
VYYYAYYLQSKIIYDFFNLEQTGTTINNLSLNTLNNTFYLIPPLKEQTQIANYLDAKTAGIDKKISLLQQKIKHYKAYRKTLINETVTKGLDKTVKLKNSGIDWIGRMPEHWEVRRLKSLGNISTSSVNKKIEEDEEIILLVNYTDVYGNKNKEIRNNPNYMKVSAKPNQIIQKNLKKGDVVFTPSSETVEDIGVSSVVMEDLKRTLYSYHILRLRFNYKVFDNFKKYMFNNDYVQYYFSKSAKGTTRKILGLNDFNNLEIVLPITIQEQKQIADYLDAKTATIDLITKNIETQIGTLQELRKTLINEVVTGKMKVID